MRAFKHSNSLILFLFYILKRLQQVKIITLLLLATNTLSAIFFFLDLEKCKEKMSSSRSLTECRKLVDHDKLKLSTRKRCLYILNGNRKIIQLVNFIESNGEKRDGAKGTRNERNVIKPFLSLLQMHIKLCHTRELYSFLSESEGRKKEKKISNSKWFLGYCCIKTQEEEEKKRDMMRNKLLLVLFSIHQRLRRV